MGASCRMGSDILLTQVSEEDSTKRLVSPSFATELLTPLHGQFGLNEIGQVADSLQRLEFGSLELDAEV